MKKFNFIDRDVCALALIVVVAMATGYSLNDSWANANRLTLLFDCKRALVNPATDMGLVVKCHNFIDNTRAEARAASSEDVLREALKNARNKDTTP